ncbi:Bifunctional TENA2 protein [Nymphaea thermarum]|nr:Bifunctional TENA2 protein [Nymphaea thermarum]
MMRSRGLRRKHSNGMFQFPVLLLKGQTESIAGAACMTAFWAIEMVYQTSFELCLQPGSKTPADLLETCQRWGNNSFKHYCSSLQSIADHCLETAEEDVLREAEKHLSEFFIMKLGFGT